MNYYTKKYNDKKAFRRKIFLTAKMLISIRSNNLYSLFFIDGNDIDFSCIRIND